ncbi:unnamed protein product [Plutella xylostella]|uniref:(diamondback moth) hypothetical protein n=1 Tax=Plutella xylostella TaxID=51655 RepID=A0A8S4G3I2_PLUXY|nr:unnamed protein product [Plutella xylostella]
MPTGAVYQPTTVTYEQQPEDSRWNCPISYFSRRVTSSLNRAVCVRLGLCLLGSTLFVIGLALVIAGGVQYSEPPPPGPEAPPSGDVAMLIAGGVVLCLGLLFAGVGFWAWSARWGGGKEAPSGGAGGAHGAQPLHRPAGGRPVRARPRRAPGSR